MTRYFYQIREWPHFHWDEKLLSTRLSGIHHKQGRILGKMENLGFPLQSEASLRTITLDVLKSSEIEGEFLHPEQVRSSIARRLGLDIAGLVPSDRHVDGMVEMLLDATQNFSMPLTVERLFNWHASLFPTGRSGMKKITVGQWRDNVSSDPMHVVSGPMGRETIHFQAPDSELVPDEMNSFITWFNKADNLDPVLKAAIAHLWCVTIHPFDDGNGRVARAIADMQLTRSDLSPQRYYSMSAQIRKERNAYYTILEETQKGDLNITPWLSWFLDCLNRALDATDETLGAVVLKAKFWERHAQTSLNDRQRTMINKLLDGIEGNLTSSKWGKMTKSSSDTALRDIQDLVSKNILEKHEAGGRSSRYIFKF